MSDASKELFDSTCDWTRLEQMISGGEAESLYYECKAPSDPKVGKDTRLHLAKACSGFANTNGGIIIYGMSTTKHGHSGLDVMTQLEPIGNVKSFAQQIENAIPSLTTPSFMCSVKVVRQNASDTRGIVLVHIPKAQSDPVQSNVDSLFYYRSGDDFVVAPYEMIKRLFAATESPDLLPYCQDRILSKNADGMWEIPVSVQNQSSAIGEHVKCVLKILNPELFESASCNFVDATSLNLGNHKTFIWTGKEPIHKGLITQMGRLLVKFREADPTKGKIPFTLVFYANKMIAREFRVTVNVKDGGLSTYDISSGDQIV